MTPFQLINEVTEVFVVNDWEDKCLILFIKLTLVKRTPSIGNTWNKWNFISRPRRKNWNPDLNPFYQAVKIQNEPGQKSLRHVLS